MSPLSIVSTIHLPLALVCDGPRSRGSAGVLLQPCTEIIIFKQRLQAQTVLPQELQTGVFQRAQRKPADLQAEATVDVRGSNPTV